jgi:hypothetical protein
MSVAVSADQVEAAVGHQGRAPQVIREHVLERGARLGGLADGYPCAAGVVIALPGGLLEMILPESQVDWLSHVSQNCVQIGQVNHQSINLL